MNCCFQIQAKDMSVDICRDVNVFIVASVISSNAGGVVVEFGDISFQDSDSSAHNSRLKRVGPLHDIEWRIPRTMSPSSVSSKFDKSSKRGVYCSYEMSSSTRVNLRRWVKAVKKS